MEEQTGWLSHQPISRKLLLRCYFCIETNLICYEYIIMGITKKNAITHISFVENMRLQR